MNAFEKAIGETFQAYRSARIANLIFLHPPMRIGGMLGKVPCFVQAGRAPFDVGGMYYDDAGTVIGVELKETKDRDNALSIVHPDKKGSGLQYHQLAALVDVHNAGGVALVVWSNGGEVGVLTGDKIALAKLQYDQSLKAEIAGKVIAKGSRSILWGWFTSSKYGVDDRPLWLPDAPKPCRKGAA